jgi:cell division protein FtsB
MTSADVEKEDARIRAIESTRAEAVAARVAAEAKFIEREKEFQELGQANKRLLAEVEDLTHQFTGLTERHDLLTNQYVALSDTEVAELTELSKTQAAQIITLVATNDDLVIQNEVFAENNAGLGKEVETLKKEVATLKGEIEGLSKKKGGLFSKKG